MSARKQFFFRERVTEGELNSAFDDLENADHHLAADLGFTGVLANAVVSPHAPVGDLTVDVSGPGILLDQQGKRIFFSSLQNVSVAQDNNGVATAVSSAGQEKVVSVFVMFDRTLSDPRIDGNSVTVFFQEDEAFKFVVVQGAEAAAGNSVPPPLRADAILLADITRRFAQGQIGAADISTARRQDAFVVTGAPRSLRRGRTLEALSDLLGLYNAHVSSTADRHPAAAIDYAGGGAWLDGVTNPTATVEVQLDKVVTDLAATTGAAKVGAAATNASPTALVAGSVKSQLDALLTALNGHVNDAIGAHVASAIAYAGGDAWKDGTTNPAATVEAQLDKVISDLAADTGAEKIGAGSRNSWLDGRVNPAGVSVLDAINKIISDLSDQTVNADGAVRIGTQVSGNLAAGSVRSQLDALDRTVARTAAANVFAAQQTLNGLPGDVNAAMATTAAPTTRKLLWEIAGGLSKYRMYATGTSLEFVTNGRWNGAAWVKDAAQLATTKFELNVNEMRISADTGGTGTFNDVWSNSIGIPLANHGQQSFDAGGNWTSPGSTETYIAWQGQSPPSGTLNVGSGAPFRKAFPATPSTVTFSFIEEANVSAGPFAVQTNAMGTGGAITVLAANVNARFYTRVIAS